MADHDADRDLWQVAVRNQSTASADLGVSYTCPARRQAVLFGFSIFKRSGSNATLSIQHTRGGGSGWTRMTLFTVTGTLSDVDRYQIHLEDGDQIEIRATTTAAGNVDVTMSGSLHSAAT